MVVDTSALVAVLVAENNSEEMLQKLRSSKTALVPASVYLECTMVLSRYFEEPDPVLANLLRIASATVVSLTEPMVMTAGKAFLQFGKGRHPAALNFGDCLVYGTAKVLGEPLLFVGNDFSLTDLSRA